ncbi:hypothetical protein BABINDRAFT_160393 [Babjeviella inositovora NRRL Y-12698]|uniref:Phospholipase n=1 Tax=Babjeviella inositovora NRRL Y-12698 TaxID=984486 RepID=A0A1E3QTG1_9ASCO|nr:uncharacterized protein BABINDRAFT_160393 [Babjeviella inositovora NRRL Y-12698]ODQ80959.1 hypothetical protein BABINDRAFT_160393 [Babjeviella inositovora NRRL Y-12698]
MTFEEEPAPEVLTEIAPNTKKKRMSLGNIWSPAFRNDHFNGQAKEDHPGNLQETPKEMANPLSISKKREDERETRYENLDDVDRARSSVVESETEPQPFSGEQSDPNTTRAETIRSNGASNTNSHFFKRPKSITATQGDETETSHERPSWYRSLSTFGAQDSTKWKDFRQALMQFKGKNRTDTPAQVAPEASERDTLARQRASELVTSLVAGVPAALFAGSIFLKDEHGTRRSPLLLSLLGFTLTDITPKLHHKNRKYRIDLEYGVGPNRLRWFVLKDTKDFIQLHSRLKVLFFQEKALALRMNKRVELPKFPRFSETRVPRHHHHHRKASTAIPETASVDGLPYTPGSASLNGGDGVSAVPENDLSSNILPCDESIALPTSFRSRLRSMASRGSMSDSSSDNPSPRTFNHKQKHVRLSLKVAEFQRLLEVYLLELTYALTIRPQSNRLFQFFELSPIGLMLASETGYLGKQGYLIVRSSAKAQGWRVSHFRARDFKAMVDRHTNKWFMIRHSYVMYVADINSTTPLEVFLVDNSFKVSYAGDDDTGFLADDDVHSLDNESLYDGDKAIASTKRPHFTITLENGEREIKMVARSKEQMRLWIKSLSNMQTKTIWARDHRFESFSPVRENCFAQWFVDGRDYFWAVSSAMEMAKDTIYIHDWWLSPELYMRRPANGNQQWRLDRILKRKAEQGVKIFVILYRNVGSTVSTDSLWAKHSLLDLHQNIHVIRSPNQLLQNTYFWAHHEKLCVVDHTVGFLGGIDLCYGRFDTPDHVLTDEAREAFAQNLTSNPSQFQMFPGKDYSNPRVKDFFDLDKPYEEMYDRQVTPRMPWHDIHMVTAGQPARDLARHFVQRWNYLLRQKRPSRPTPLLLPPPEFTNPEIEALGLQGTCEVQLLRSCCNWSLGLKDHEQSIQNAYLKLIETSEHFVYIENQFFITASAWDGVVIKNRIGDALVDRIIRAHKEGTAWRACIVIPLMPGFEAEVDEPEGSAIRIIMQCQFMSISRGPTSIFAKLRMVGIDPDDYIQFFSLRKWARIGPKKNIVSEQLYIHAKAMVVDDRVAIIGSANINERSMRGVRDSEFAAVVRDREVVHTKMNGAPYSAGLFAHSLRMRLMREHLGIDVDIIELVERRFNALERLAKSEEGLKAATAKFKTPEGALASAMVELGAREVMGEAEGTQKWKLFQSTNGFNDAVLDMSNDVEDLPPHLNQPPPPPLSFNHRAGEENAGIRDKKNFSSDARVQNNAKHREDVEGNGPDRFGLKAYKKYALKALALMAEWAQVTVKGSGAPFVPAFDQVSEFLHNDTDIDGLGEMSKESEVSLTERNAERWTMLKRVAYLQRVAAKHHKNTAKLHGNGSGSAKTGSIDPEAADPAGSSAVKEHPESESPGGLEIPIVSLDEQGVSHLLETMKPDSRYEKFIDPYGFEDPLDEEFYEDVWFENAYRNTKLFRTVFHCQPDDAVTTWKEYKNYSKLNAAFWLSQTNNTSKHNHTDEESDDGSNEVGSIFVKEFGENDRGVIGMVPPGSKNQNSNEMLDVKNGSPREGTHRDRAGTPVSEESEGNREDRGPRLRKRAGTFGTRHKRPRHHGDRIFDRQTAEKICSEVQGHLVLFPVDWLYKEVDSGNFFYSADRIPPIEIYD